MTRMTDDQIRAARMKIGVRRGLTQLDALDAERDRARSEEARLLKENSEKDATIKALADALVSVKLQLPERVLDDGMVGTLTVREDIDTALHLAGRLP